MKKINILLAIALVSVPCIGYAEFETSYKKNTAQEYSSVAKTQGSGIVRELSKHSQGVLSSQMSHMNAYEKKKYIAKINSYYGTKLTEQDFESSGSKYANDIRLTVENNSRATTVEHAVDMAKINGQSAPAGMNQETYEKMVRTQEAAKQSGNLGMDYAKQMMGEKAATSTIRQFSGN